MDAPRKNIILYNSARSIAPVPAPIAPTAVLFAISRAVFPADHVFEIANLAHSARNSESPPASHSVRSAAYSSLVFPPCTSRKCLYAGSTVSGLSMKHDKITAALPTINAQSPCSIRVAAVNLFIVSSSLFCATRVSSTIDRTHMYPASP